MGLRGGVFIHSLKMVSRRHVAPFKALEVNLASGEGLRGRKQGVIKMSSNSLPFWTQREEAFMAKPNTLVCCCSGERKTGLQERWVHGSVSGPLSRNPSKGPGRDGCMLSACSIHSTIVCHMALRQSLGMKQHLPRHTRPKVPFVTRCRNHIAKRLANHLASFQLLLTNNSLLPRPKSGDVTATLVRVIHFKCVVDKRDT